MSCIQVTACHLAVNLKDGYPLPCVSRMRVNHVSMNSLALVPRVSKLRKHGPVCLFGDKGKSENTDEASPWKAMEKAMGNLKKESSIEDVLKQQMAKQEFYDGGGNIGGNPPGSGGGGGGGGGSDESEDEGFSGIMEEVLQVTLATLGFVFLYIYIIDGEDITRLAKDFIKFLFGGKKSVRLRRVMYEWAMFFQRFTKKKEVEENWLEYAIINTPTWYDSPEKYKRILRSHFASRSDL